MTVTLASPNVAPYATLAELRREHTSLLKAMHAGSSEKLNAELRQFLARAQATGALLDAPADRETAQGILDYWAASLFTRASDFPWKDSKQGAVAPSISPAYLILADFDTARADQVAGAAEKMIQELNEADRELARRILLRLVRLAPEGRSYQLESRSRAELETLGEPARVRNILDRLQAAGVVHASPGPDAIDQFALTREALTRTWSSLARWLEQRVRFRDTARYWDKNNRDGAALISGHLLNEAHSYHDLNSLERAYIDASLDTELRRNRILKCWIAVLAVLVVIAVIGWIVAWMQASEAKAKKDEADENAKVAKREATTAAVQSERAVKQEALAKAAGEEVDKAHKALKASTENKEFLTNTLVLLRCLFEVSRATDDDERQIGLERWKFTADTVKNDKKVKEFIDENKDEIDRLVKELSDPNIRKNRDENATSHQEVVLARKLRKKLLGLNDKEVVALLRDRRFIAFGTAEYCAEELVKAFREGDFGGVDAYKRQFWSLYYGDIGFLGDDRVTKAMKAFGDQLGEINRTLVVESAPEAKKELDAKTLRASDLKKLGTQQVIKSATKLLPSHKTAIDSIVAKKANSSRLNGQVSELDRILRKELMPAFEAENKSEITPALRLPTGY